MDIDSTLATVTVTYNPEISQLAAQLQVLPEGAVKVVVDNASRQELRESIRALTEQVPNSHFIANPTNVGLAAALNSGVNAASGLAPGARFVLLLDQDSEPGPGSIDKLLTAFHMLEEAGHRVGAVGPRLVDVATGLDHGFHRIKGWRWSRFYPSSDSLEPVRIDNINGSGSLIPIRVYEQLGGLEEDFFIDHVDTEWAFRLKAAGYRLFGVPDSVFNHRMGERCMRFWCLGWRVWPHRAPSRHYYLFRNAVRLIRRDQVPIVWKIWAGPKLILTMAVHLLADSQRRQQIVAMVRGIRAGLHKDQEDV